MIEISQYLFYKLINVLHRPYYINKIYPIEETRLPINIPSKTKY
jgi:hypothetical protein